jgi:hypothetical protein
MNEPPQDKKRPRLTDRALAEQQARKEREAAALRENLRKRKEQVRAKAGPADQLSASTIRPETPDQCGE